MGKHRKWDKANMLNAVTAVKEKRLGYTKASRLYDIRSTLKDYVNSSQDIYDKLKTTIGRPTPIDCGVRERIKRLLSTDGQKLLWIDGRRSNEDGLRTCDPKQFASSIFERKKECWFKKKKRMNSRGKIKKKSATKKKLSFPETLGESSKPKKSSQFGSKVKKRETPSSCESDISEEDIPYVLTDDEDSDCDVPCKICQKPFSSDKEGEKWVRCTACFQWCHEVCSSLPNTKKFICDFCAKT